MEKAQSLSRKWNVRLEQEQNIRSLSPPMFYTHSSRNTYWFRPAKGNLPQTLQDHILNCTGANCPVNPTSEPDLPIVVVVLLFGFCRRRLVRQDDDVGIIRVVSARFCKQHTDHPGPQFSRLGLSSLRLAGWYDRFFFVVVSIFAKTTQSRHPECYSVQLFLVSSTCNSRMPVLPFVSSFAFRELVLSFLSVSKISSAEIKEIRTELHSKNSKQFLIAFFHGQDALQFFRTQMKDRFPATASCAEI